MALVQIGIKALRAPSGEFLESVPIFAEIPKERITPEGLTKTEDKTIDDISRIMAQKFKQYIDGVKAAEKNRR